MRPTWLRVTLAVVALGLVSAEGAAAKCFPQLAWPGLEPGAPVMMLDGSIIGTGLSGGEEIFVEIDPSDIHSIDIICWNPATGEFEPGRGVNIIFISTKRLMESKRDPIEVLLRAQEAYFFQHSRYARSLDDLGELSIPRDAMLEFSATSSRWSATTPRDDSAYRCFVDPGNAAPELAGRMKQHEVVCQPETAGASRALREMYESLAKG